MTHHITQDCTGCTACTTLCPAQAIEGSKKEVHHILGDRCLDCGACGRICPANAVEDAFGTRIPKQPRRRWPKPEFDLKACASCGICLDACPVKALDTDLMVVRDVHAYPWLARPKACIGCGFCAVECPVDAVTLTPPETVKA
ncbi:MAG: 4Fe-4S binding protein [Desulfobacterales bacterium]|nr:4Fe-4S binding protein [Desulfobacterales bacterium]